VDIVGCICQAGHQEEGHYRPDPLRSYECTNLPSLDAVFSAPAEKEVPTAMSGRLRPAANLSARCTPRATSGTSPASRS
jgi:hypothetical protein